MTKFTVYNQDSGVVFGVYEGADKAEALEAWAQDAGYASTAEVPTGVDDIAADEVAIDLGKVFTDTRYAVRVRYYPVFGSGNYGHVQEAYLPWEGDLNASEGEMIEAARENFAARFPDSHDNFVFAEIVDRYAIMAGAN